MFLKMNPASPSPWQVSKPAKLLAAGGLVFLVYILYRCCIAGRPL
jgi:hypothetical protein